MRRLLLASALLASVARAEPRCEMSSAPAECWRWSAANYVLESAFVAAVAVDWLQTRTTALSPHGVEVGPFLPRRPTLAQVNLACAAAVVGHALVSLALPSPWRELWQVSTFAIAVGNVGMNFSAGVTLTF